ncbi:MAG: S-adenosyl-l-methionine hydroxide adenosyltransferase family protein [Candidatus Methanoperedens sp.]|nr:S-adenosyl-l-methionine hydroxide adenosyltransferase family protein [Candidatus Methanoperedens sp.]
MMVITLLSDFGDVYPASMKGAIYGINRSASIVDISHSVPAHDVRTGAFILMISARSFPSDTVHIAVVDPGVGTQRRAIAIRADSDFHGIHYFIGPNNGLLIPAAKSLGYFKVYEITNTNLFRKQVSSTFHGRDIFAPVGAHISKGLDISVVGKQIFDYVDLDFGKGLKKDGSLQGRIIFIDQFGNLVTNISSDMVDFQFGDVLDIQNVQVLFHKSYGFCRKGEPVAMIGSHGFLEIAVNRGNAAQFFNKKPGDEIIVRKIT